MKDGADNHQETDKRAIVAKTNSGYGFRKPKLERKRGSKRNLGSIRKPVDLSAETIISHCFGQRLRTVPPRNTNKPERTALAELRNQFLPSTSDRSSVQILKCSQEGFMSPKLPKPS